MTSFSDLNDPILVSVIMPVHNRFLFADEAIATVVAQTHRPIELIIVDDFSIEPYQPKTPPDCNLSVKLIRTETNQGPGASREAGRLSASGKYIAYLDSDDLWHPRKIEKQIALLEANPDAGMCYCQTVEFSQFPLTGNESFRERSDQAFFSFLPTIYGGRPWCTSACLWTMKAVRRIGPWINAWTWEDYEYDCRAGCADIPIVYVPEVLCYYRRNYNDTQLSKIPFSVAQLQRAPAVLSIARELTDSHKINDEITRIWLESLTFKSSMASFANGDKELAVTMLKMLLKISNTPIKLISYKSLLLLQYILPLQFISRLGNWLYSRTIAG